MGGKALQRIAKVVSKVAPASQDDAGAVRLPGGQSLPQNAVVVARLVGLTAAGAPLVSYPESPVAGEQEALSTVELKLDDVGREVTLAFVGGDARRPVVSGILRSSRAGTASARKQVTVRLDGERILLSAERELVLQCGKASITLQRDGTLVLSGTDLLSRSSGGNRIRGGSVSLN